MAIPHGRKDGKRPVWSEYTQDPADWLFLRVTVKIAGGHPQLFVRYETAEAAQAARLEEDRRAAWENTVTLAEQLWRSGTHREFFVIFRPEDPNIGREAVCIYRRLHTQTSAGKAMQ